MGDPRRRVEGQKERQDIYLCSLPAWGCISGRGCICPHLHLLSGVGPVHHHSNFHWLLRTPFPSLAAAGPGVVMASCSCQFPSAISLFGFLSPVHTWGGRGGVPSLKSSELSELNYLRLGAWLIPAPSSRTFYCPLLENCGEQFTFTFIRSPVRNGAAQMWVEVNNSKHSKVRGQTFIT